MKFMPYSRQCLDKKDIREVMKVLNSDWLTQGPKIKEFEDSLCKYAGARYAVAVSSGTAALHIACLAAGLKKGDEAITSPITFAASANCVLYCGGRPVFSDIEPDTANINPEDIKKKITRKTKAIIPVHFAGQPCELEKIRDTAQRNNLIVIEDAAHALGASYKGSKIGYGKYSDMTIFSFHPVKAITTGEGGSVLTNRKDLYDRLLVLRNHGITRNIKLLRKKPLPWYYEMKTLGFNYRLTDIQSALGISQLKKIDKFLSARKKISAQYSKAFKDIEWLRALEDKNGRVSARHLYIALIDFKKIRKKREEVIRHLKRKGIGTQVHYIPLYRHPYYRNSFDYEPRDFPMAEKYYQRALSLPLYPGLSEEQVNYITKEVLGLYNI
ncbi:MAG TPA: UDP-4-amino-4,6-dideoxy-N-acetyl-beta-L-altrosamine transaminase [Candidatus Omnitrophota bacterium]|nr:UDP-4-amino-4,6-dideoxy-N-acetyl-beta-L-altrosamine transaminase [Candidatus Omnitrophota bacterium]